MDRSHHWDAIYTKREAEEVSWYEAIPTASIQRVREVVERGARSVIDIGGGASRLVDHLVEMNLDRITVLDISRRALDIARRRVGTAGEAVEWVVGDITRLDDLGTFDVWHDRAVFHFLTDSSECRRYVALCERTVEPGGMAVMATFAPDGPEMCSGLPVHRYDAQELSERCGSAFELVDDEHYVHVTPAGVEQSFVYSSFRRVTSSASLSVATV
jgi:2-polyprenyl-3-methyl-5-hydroxy-6-metoxy-1,4-benzoquinol methylase